MGLLGMEISSILSDRIFRVLDKDNDGKIYLKEYIQYSIINHHKVFGYHDIWHSG